MANNTRAIRDARERHWTRQALTKGRQNEPITDVETILENLADRTVQMLEEINQALLVLRKARRNG